MIRGNISARSLAEFTCRSGDLYPTRMGRQVEADEGIQRQKDIQNIRLSNNSNYQREVLVTLDFDCAGETRRLTGRVDGLSVSDDQVVVEEFKCTGHLPDHADPVDQGQARIYAGMVAQADDTVQKIDVRVVYIHADTLAERFFSEEISRDKAIANLVFLLACYSARIARHRIRNTQRQAWANELKFPMPHYRPSQQAIARRVYRAIENGENLLLEAPTGSGKTLAVLYPALKAQQIDEQLFFLTSRNAGAAAVLAGAQQLDRHAGAISVVQITAKDKTCFLPDTPCDAEQCAFAKGYFDRVAEAVDVVLARRHADRSSIEAIAREFEVCPFELSLDAALWADLIVGDYNYIFDPVVRLQRFAGHDQLHLLVDEAHQLSPRVRDMLTVDVDRHMVRKAKNVLHPRVEKRVASIDRALLKIRRAQGEGEHQLDNVDAFERACTRLLEVVAEEEVVLEAYPDLIDLYFAVARWIRSRNWYSEDDFVHIADISEHQVQLRRGCLDAGPYMQTVFAEHGAVVRFSGTVTPLPLYQRLHGQLEGFTERAQSPFNEAQACVLIVRDIPTYYKQRDASMAKLVTLIEDITTTTPGRYLVALPSYAYLKALASALGELWRTNTATNPSAASPELFVQQPGQSNAETEALLRSFSLQENAVIGIVMGGVLGESVDFGEAKLRGVIMIGLGLPPPSLERNLLQRHFEQAGGSGWGRMVAYTQPALVKNIQAAGRLIRSEEDFGVICLVDPRFASTEVQRFFPSHWRPQITSARDVKQTVKQFWHKKISREDSGAL